MIWVIEPHVDDAFLSLHAHIQNWVASGETVGIYTVFSNARRQMEGEQYASKVKAQYASLGCEEGMNGLEGATKVIPLSKWDTPFRKRDQLVFPIGLQHPDHKTIGDMAPKGCWRYLDVPYVAKQKLGEYVNRSIEGMTIVSIRFASKRKWRHIEIFKSQAKFYYYNPPETMSKIPEIVLENPHG